MCDTSQRTHTQKEDNKLERGMVMGLAAGVLLHVLQACGVCTGLKLLQSIWFMGLGRACGRAGCLILRTRRAHRVVPLAPCALPPAPWTAVRYT